MAARKRSSYPSRQPRQGPAPLASFEDLSDEIESPTEKNSHSLPEIEEELKLFADAATPSTPRLLANTPSTPQADLSSASTPKAINGSWGANLEEDGGATSGSAFVSQSVSRDSMLDSSGEGIAELHTEKTRVTLPQNNAIKNSKSSSFMDDVKGAEAASELANSLPERSATPECLPQKAPTKKDSLTTTKDANGQRSRTPSRTPSPNSPRRFFSFFKHKDESSEPGSPSSPKSPRKTSFTNLFRIGSRSPDDHSPTRRKSSLSIFFKGGKDKDGGKNKNVTDEPASAKGKKEASNRSKFSNFFRKDDRKSPVKLTLQATSVDIPVEIDLGTGTGWTSREISLHSHLCDLEDHDHDVDVESDHDLEEKEEMVDNKVSNSTSVQVHVESHEPDQEEDEAPPLNDTVKVEEIKVKPQKPERRDKFASGDAHKSDTFSSVEDDGKKEQVGSIEDKISSGSEQESDCDPVSLKKRVTDEDYEAETLIDDEADYDEFPVNSIITEPKRTPLTPLRRQRAVDVTTVPIERPRSSTPLSITSLEAYIQTASPPPSRLSKETEKLKVCLPGEEFLTKGKSPRKIMAVRNWQEFCQEALQSPRIRRRESEELQLHSRVLTSAPDSTNASSPGVSWVTFENVAEVRRPRLIGTAGQRIDPKTSQQLFEQQAESTASIPRRDEERSFFPSDNFSVSCESRSTDADLSYFVENVNDGRSASLFSHAETSGTEVPLPRSAPPLPERRSIAIQKVDVNKSLEQTSPMRQQQPLDALKLSKMFGSASKEKFSSQESADSSTKLSSMDSIGSSDVPISLDTVECKDPLLDPSSESEFSMDETETNFTGGLNDIDRYQPNVFSDDLKRPGL